MTSRQAFEFFQNWLILLPTQTAPVDHAVVFIYISRSFYQYIFHLFSDSGFFPNFISPFTRKKWRTFCIRTKLVWFIYKLSPAAGEVAAKIPFNSLHIPNRWCYFTLALVTCLRLVPSTCPFSLFFSLLVCELCLLLAATR